MYCLRVVAFGNGRISDADAQLVSLGIRCVIGWIYFAVMESSPLQGTLGKIALGIKVTDLIGNRPSFGQTTGRWLGKWVSSLILSVGWWMAAFTPKRQALHDMIAGCLVVQR
jgi:uncharacterized RDD family membrane protein YckC